MEAVIIVSYHSFQDPLFKGLILQYLQAYQQQHPNRYAFHVLTHEQQSYQQNEAEREQIFASLRQENIHIYPQPYTTGGALILVKKGIGFLRTLAICTQIRLRHRTTAILGFLAYGGILAYWISLLLRIRLITFCFEPHSEYLIDFGDWPRSSFRYRLTSWMEKRSVMGAKFLTVPTRHTVDLVNQWGTKAEVSLVPISVDTEKFVFSEKGRAALREGMGTQDRTVLFYLGKFGGLYYTLEEATAFFGQLHQRDPSLFFYIISTAPPEDVEAALIAAGLQSSDFSVSGPIPYDRVEVHLSAADFGLLAIPPLPSQRYRTPIKTGNYLSCGVPVITTAGVSDEDDWLEPEEVGVVIPDYKASSSELLLEKMKPYLQMDKDTLRKRCREAAIRHRGLHRSQAVLEHILDHIKS